MAADMITDPVLIQVLTIVAVTAVFGIGLAQVYLLLFGWPARRLVHDLASGSVVVYTDTREIPARKGPVHAVVNGFDLGIASYRTSGSVPYRTDCTTADVKCLEE
jgi:hypothetical protein